MIQLLSSDSLKHAVRPLAPYIPKFAHCLSWRRSFNALKCRGFGPKTIFDIGVGYGTPQLYRAFPEAFYYLIEPSKDALPHIQRISRKLQCEIINVALGDRDGDVEMEIRADLNGSTLFEDFGARKILRREKVKMRRFENLIAEFERPALCKIDVQGSEMLVLKGIGDRARDIEAFIVETSTISTLRDGPEIYEILQFMKQYGFVIYDILSIAHRPLDRALAQVDLLLIPEKSALRSDRRWKDMKQREKNRRSGNAYASSQR